MNRRNHASTARQRLVKASRSRWALPLAFASALLAGTASAGIAIPDNPLTTTARIPPNLMFIMDNSGSMALVSMPFDVEDPNYSGTGTGRDRVGLRDDPHDRSYLNNTIYYNPNITYQPWMRSDGTRMSGGQDVSEVYANWNFADDRFERDLRGNVESIFYVPKTGVTSSTNPNDFVRYWIRNNGGNAEVVRQRDPAATLQTWAWDNRNIDEASWWRETINVPAGTTTLVISVANGTDGSNGGNAELYVRRTNQPSTSNYDYSDTGTTNDESVTITNPQSGTWHIGVYNSSSGSGDRRVYNNDISAVARNDLELATPTGRTQAAELVNIATWYSYYRTRMKTAKGGALEAFNDLGRDVRVGYTGINGRAAGLGSSGTSEVIPVNTNNGLFEGVNRSNWYDDVIDEYVQDGSTPLRTALNAVGGYYQRSNATGPYGPESNSDQFSCRQNFAILTTDGYWNDSTGSAFSKGDEDGDGHSVSLADIAFYYYANDLRSNLDNTLLPTPTDPATWQHMVTFGISIGLQGTLPITDPPPAPNAAVWPNPMTSTEDARRIDDLWHAAVNSHGKFVAANDPEAFASGLSSALAEIEARTSSFSNVATNSVSLDTDTQVFSASYVSGTWTGQVSATPVTGSGLGATAWTSSIPSYPGRASQIYTSRTVSGTQTGTSFPTDAQVSALDRSSASPVNFPVTGELNADYIAGSRALERSNGGILRNRNGVLGDIVNSSPAYVKDTNTLYVGANDGMMHAFDAETGEELFAYIPSGINWANLSTISRPDYSHKFFVDGPISVSSRSLTPDENILVGTLGRGGKGLYSLNVDSPASFSASDFNWELKETPGNNMGLVLGKPLLTNASTGEKVAIIGNGINSTSERAVLVVVDLNTGNVIREIDTGEGSAAMPNGLSAPAGVFGPDGKTLAYVYAGDMLGNVWKFDLTSPTPGSWGVEKLFTAADNDGVSQPITSGVTVATHPRTFKRWVFFGTGRFLTAGDAAVNTDNQVQSMYGFEDGGSPPILDRDDLTEREVTVAGTVNGYPVRGFEPNDQLPTDSKGWYIDLVEAGSGEAVGERIVQNAQVVATVLVTASIIPTGDACEAGGRGYINALDAFTGTSSSVSYFDLDGDGQTGDELVGSGNGQVPVGSVNLGNGMPTLPSLLRGMIVAGGSGTGSAGALASRRPRWGRVSWHEIKKE